MKALLLACMTIFTASCVSRDASSDCQAMCKGVYDIISATSSDPVDQGTHDAECETLSDAAACEDCYAELSEHFGNEITFDCSCLYEDQLQNIASDTTQAEEECQSIIDTHYDGDRAALEATCVCDTKN